jgi:hypothetical protein
MIMMYVQVFLTRGKSKVNLFDTQERVARFRLTGQWPADRGAIDPGVPAAVGFPGPSAIRVGPPSGLSLQVLAASQAARLRAFRCSPSRKPVQNGPIVAKAYI